MVWVWREFPKHRYFDRSSIAYRQVLSTRAFALLPHIRYSAHAPIDRILLERSMDDAPSPPQVASRPEGAWENMNTSVAQWMPDDPMSYAHDETAEAQAFVDSVLTFDGLDQDGVSARRPNTSEQTASTTPLHDTVASSSSLPLPSTTVGVLPISKQSFQMPLMFQFPVPAAASHRASPPTSPMIDSPLPASLCVAAASASIAPFAATMPAAPSVTAAVINGVGVAHSVDVRAVRRCPAHS
jgi:hypothetical protein